MVLRRLNERIQLSLVTRIARDRRGVTALEYALLTALIAIAIAGGITMFSTDAKTVFSTVSNTL